MNPFLDQLKSKLSAKAQDALVAEPPWKAKSVVAAAVTTIGGLAGWLSNNMSPAVARLGASYLGGFFIGWLFRRFVKIAVLLAGVVIALVAGLKSTGWITLDWVGLEAQVHESVRALQRGAEGLKQVLSGYLPSAGAGTAGIFFGFRKKQPRLRLRPTASSCTRPGRNSSASPRRRENRTDGPSHGASPAYRTPAHIRRTSPR
jgi:uncharacterized membrane protein (Fun14 family)